MYAGKLIFKHKFSMFYQCAEALVCHGQYLAKQATLCSAFQFINQLVKPFFVISIATNLLGMLCYVNRCNHLKFICMNLDCSLSFNAQLCSLPLLNSLNCMPSNISICCSVMP